jgi:hypothetical protein
MKVGRQVVSRQQADKFRAQVSGICVKEEDAANYMAG